MLRHKLIFDELKSNQHNCYIYNHMDSKGQKNGHLGNSTEVIVKCVEVCFLQSVAKRFCGENERKNCPYTSIIFKNDTAFGTKNVL